MIPQHFTLNAIKLSVCQYQLKDIFVCSFVIADTVQCEPALGEGCLEGMLCCVLTAMLELIDTTCQRPEGPQRAMTVACAGTSFCKSLTRQINKNYALPGMQVVHHCAYFLCANFSDY